MAVEDTMFVVDEKLSSIPVTSLLRNRDSLWLRPDGPPSGDGNTVHGSGNEEALPISQDGTLQTGVLYPSSIDPMVRYYLPQYQLHIANGRYTTSLKYRSANDDPNGPLAWLTIELDAVAPQASSFTLREIDHQAVVRIGYQMPVYDSSGKPIAVPAPTRVQDGTVIDDFVGNWVNVDANTNGMTRLQIAKVDAATLSYHGYGKCHPTDCDWGIINVPFTAGKTSGNYQFSFKTTQITIQRTGDLLTAIVFDHYAPGDGRPDHNNTYVLKRTDASSSTPPIAGPMLWIEVGALNPTANNTRRCQLAILLKPDFDRLYQIMTNSSYNAHLEIQCFASIGRRTWRQIIIGNINTTTQLVALNEKQVLFSNALNTNTLAVVKPNILTESSVPISLQQNTDEETAIQAPTAILAHPVFIDHPSPVLDQPVLALHEQVQPVLAAHIESSPVTRVMATSSRPINSFPPVGVTQFSLQERSSLDELPILAKQPLPTATAVSVSSTAFMTTVSQPALARAYAPSLVESLPSSDLLLKIDATAAPLATLPLRAVTDPYGLPALFKIEGQANQQITPFFFAKDTNAYMFDIPGDIQPSTNHILIRLNTVDSSGITGTFYQDSAFQDIFYYQPTEFRLSRLATYPYLPDLLVAFYDAVSQNTTNNTTTIHYRVVLTYRALPYIDPHVLETARTTFAIAGVTPRFTALAPVSSKLFLTLQNQQVERTSAQINFSDGIVDNVELASTDFEQIFTQFQSPSGLGLSGSVRAQLFDNSQAAIPLNLSLVNTAGPVFDRTFNGPVAGTQGQYQITLRNHIESSVQINNLFGVIVAPNTTASPVTAAAGTIVKPGGTLVLTYQATPATATITDIEPEMSISVLVDQTTLWRSLMINQGYTSDTFQVHVSIDPGYFGPPPAGAEPITGVQVEFQADSSITLASAQPAMDVTLRMPLLPRLLKDPNAQQYLYRVTDLHASGPGARTKWQKHEGDLVVTPAILAGA